jgi:hypothetical protein
MNRRNVLPNSVPIRAPCAKRDREGLLFDVGLEALRADPCIRTSDTGAIAKLRTYTASSVFEAGNLAMGVILAVNPHRVFVSRLGRLEVYQRIPPATGNSHGSHTHVLPKPLPSNPTHPATEPVLDLRRLQHLLLTLFAETLKIGFAVRIERLLVALLPCSSKFGRRDVPVWSAFPADSTQVLAKLFHLGSSEEPVATVDLVNDKTGLQHDYVRNHGIVDRIGIFGDVEILLNDAPRIGEKGPVGAYSAAIFVRLGDIVGADRDQPTIANLHLTMEEQQTFCLTAILWAEGAAAKDKNQGVVSL